MEKRPFDAIVVGTGPGGATVARELTNRGKRVSLHMKAEKRIIFNEKERYLSFLITAGSN